MKHVRAALVAVIAMIGTHALLMSVFLACFRLANFGEASLYILGFLAAAAIAGILFLDRSLTQRFDANLFVFPATAFVISFPLLYLEFYLAQILDEASQTFDGLYYLVALQIMILFTLILFTARILIALFQFIRRRENRT